MLTSGSGFFRLKCQTGLVFSTIAGTLVVKGHHWWGKDCRSEIVEEKALVPVGATMGVIQGAKWGGP